MQTYPKASLVRVKGKWYVQATIPPHLREAFKGKKQLRRSTGTSDRGEAERRLHGKAGEIFEEFRRAERLHDPLTNAANALSQYLPGEPSWSSEDWEPESFSRSEWRIEALYYNFMHVDPFGLEGPEDYILLGQMRDKAEQLYYDYRDELERRKASGPRSTRCVSSVSEELIANRKFGRQKTRQDHERAVQKFIAFAGDLPISQVDRPLALSFVDELAQRLAHNTLQRDVTFVRQVFAFALDRGWIDRNPFEGVSLRGKGASSTRRIPFRPSQLQRLFALDMKPQDRLCLSILAATGMRLDEVALLEWQDIRDEGGIRYFDLQRMHKVVKNETAARQVPVPSALRLPPRGVGRLFTYRRDADGKAQNAASKALMKYIRKVRDDQTDSRLTVHSLRHTYKDALREAGVPEEVQNFLMGHSGAGQGSRYGSGPSLAVKAKWVETLDLSFLNGKTDKQLKVA
ncbi:integrase [Limimaricola variabilis]|uniref:Integrase n=1 Tax=Limimaricola variabilis TaxID=1492771 RepID=A0ABR6HMA3_9RHOB|nr:DUF6538 domain-containing protein [Limimaricola variabilis]MBB3711575.1 integrase [Limimaricola variabilis]